MTPILIMICCRHSSFSRLKTKEQGFIEKRSHFGSVSAGASPPPYENAFSFSCRRHFTIARRSFQDRRSFQEFATRIHFIAALPPAHRGSVTSKAPCEVSLICRRHTSFLTCRRHTSFLVTCLRKCCVRWHGLP